MDEMAASIAELGIVEPLIVAPPFSAKGRKTSWRYTLIAGQRRLVGAVAAELTTVPCMVRHDLDTPAKQLLVMQIENDHRKGLRVTEQADGYQALFELDMAPAFDRQEARPDPRVRRGPPVYLRPAGAGPGRGRPRPADHC